MRSASKHLMIFCTLLAMLWVQVFGLQHHLFVCLCTDELVETIVDHCHDASERQNPQLAHDAEHHQQHDCDQNERDTQHHTRLKDDLKARSQTGTEITPENPVLVMLFSLPDPFAPKLLSTITGTLGWTPCAHPLTPPLSVQVHQSVVFLI